VSQFDGCVRRTVIQVGVGAIELSRDPQGCVRRILLDRYDFHITGRISDAKSKVRLPL
jgi:hypothetical protein